MVCTPIFLPFVYTFLHFIIIIFIYLFFYHSLWYVPHYSTFLPLVFNSSSISINLLYLAVLSDLQGAPVLIYLAPSPTTKSDIKVSSVSPLRWLTITFQPLLIDMLLASILSVIVPIWLILSNRALHIFCCRAMSILLIFVTNKSSPTI